MTRLFETPINSRKNISKRVGTGLVTVLAATAFGGMLPAAVAYPTKSKDSIAKTRRTLTHAYLPGSVKLVSAKNTGIIPMLSNHAPDREIVTAHIDYKVGASPKLLGLKGEPFPPKERVLGPNNTTRPGVVEWAEYPSGSDVNMQVQLGPFLSNKETTRKYQLYLTALSRAGNHGKQLAADFYAGTVDISGKNGNITSVSVEHEPKIPDVRVYQLQDPSYLYGPSNANPRNG